MPATVTPTSADVQQLHRDIDAGFLLPTRWYADPAIFQAELERIHRRAWHFATHTGDLKQPGDVYVRNLAGVPILLVRGADGELRGFVNICRHRGHPVAMSSGNQPKLRCHQHAWTYGLDGALRATPHLPGVALDGLGLHHAELSMWAGFLFVRLVPGGTTFAEELGPIAARVARYPLAELVTAHTRQYEVVANWKVLAENYNECYHCGPVHPELCDLVPAFRRQGGADLDWERGIPHRSGAYTFTSTGTSDRRPFPGLDADERERHKGELVYPNLLLSLSCDHVVALVLRPSAPGTTTVECRFMFHPDEVVRPGFDPSDAIDLWDVVNRQDWSICERVQRGMASRWFAQGWFAPMEDPSLDIRRWWSRRLEPQPAPGGTETAS
jgi:glycine betaine catabolism A